MSSTSSILKNFIDPILQSCLQYALLERPYPAGVAMLSYFLTWKMSGNKPILSPSLTISSSKPTREQKIYLIEEVGPVISKLTNHITMILKKKQKIISSENDALDLIIHELELLLQDEGLINDQHNIELLNLAIRESINFDNKINNKDLILKTKELPYQNILQVDQINFPQPFDTNVNNLLSKSVSKLNLFNKNLESNQETDSKLTILKDFKSDLDSKSINVNDSKQEMDFKGTIYKESKQEIEQNLIKKNKNIDQIKFNIAVLGIDGSGKSTFTNLLQGKVDPNVKPTIGFRLISTKFTFNPNDNDDKSQSKYENNNENNNESDDEVEITLQLYDLGGKKQIRDIWKEYFHDIHAVIYLIDSTSKGNKLRETIKEYETLLHNKLLFNKPFLILNNKIDQEGSKSISMYKDLLEYDIEEINSTILALNNKELDNESESEDEENNEKSLLNNIKKLEKEEEKLIDKILYYDCTCKVDNIDEIIPDINIINSLEELCKKIMKNLTIINDKINIDSIKKKKQDLKKRMNKEKNVLRRKLCSINYDNIKLNIIEKYNLLNCNNDFNNENLFTSIEGIQYLQNEIGTDIEFTKDAEEICKLLHYERLSLQIVGNFVSPINKKMKPLNWKKILNIVKNLRIELGLSNDI